MRRWLRPLWIVLALLFLLEAWLWDHLEPIVARVVGLIPWGPIKATLARLVERLPPWAVLFIFFIPFIVMSPLKIIGVYFLAKGNWFGAISIFVLVKLFGLGLTAFIFDLTREKLLQMAWFRRVYDWFMWARDWAHAQTDPIRQKLHRLTWLLKPQRAGRFLRRLIRLRRRAYRSRAA